MHWILWEYHWLFEDLKNKKVELEVLQWEVKKLFGNILTQKVSARTLTVSGECNFGWRIVHNCKTNNNDDIYIKQQNQTKNLKKLSQLISLLQLSKIWKLRLPTH